MSSWPEVGIGMVGCGFVADIHENACRRVTGVCASVKAVAGRSRGKAEEFGKSRGIPDVYDDYRRLLDRRDIHVIDLCVPNNLHKRMAVEAAEAGKHVICEKPLTGFFGEDRGGARTGNDEAGGGVGERIGDTVRRSDMFERAVGNACEMLEAARRNRVKLCYAENWVYAPSIQKAKRLADASQGAILNMIGEESHSGSHAQYSRRWRTAGGGSLFGKGSHPIGAVLYLKRNEGLRRSGRPIRPQYVVGDVGRLTRIERFRAEEPKWIVAEWEDVEDWATCTITFEDGSKAVIVAADTVVGGIQNRLEVYLTNARINCHISLNTACTAFACAPAVFADEYIIEKTQTKAGWSFPSIDEEWMTGYPQEFQDFMECVAFDREPLSDGELGRDVVKVIYGAYASAEAGGKVSLDLG